VGLGRTDEDHVDPFSRGPRVHIIGQAQGHQPPKITVVPKAGFDLGEFSALNVDASFSAWSHIFNNLCPEKDWY
jgi:hypothetical protein